MATLKEYFDTDFGNAFALNFQWEIINETRKIEIKVVTEVYSEAKLVCYFVPKCTNAFVVTYELLKNVNKALDRSEELISNAGHQGDIKLGFHGSNFSAFSNRIYLYLENDFTKQELSQLELLVRQSGLGLTIRGYEYMTKRNKQEKPLAFISHDSRDKENIANPIARGLLKLLCPVWYDEFSLQVGDNIRKSIERGIKESKKCILIISQNFIRNEGWCTYEFDTIITKEIFERNGVIIPVWVNVNKEEVYNFSPILANKHAAM